MPKFSDDAIEAIFGADDAENEDPARLKEYFYYNNAYESLLAPLPIRILVGHKGVGKSALLKRAYYADIEDSTPSIWLKSNDIVDIKNRAGSQADFIYKIEAWKKGIIYATISHFIDAYYGNDSISQLPELSSSSTRSLIKFLFLLMDKNSPRPSPPSINVYIDDIDRGWSATRSDVQNISALLNAVRDLGGDQQRIRFRLGLRSDVYFLVRTSDESTDKIERNIIWLRWDNDQILRLLGKRIATYFKLSFAQTQIDNMTQGQITANILSKVIEPTFKGSGRWQSRPIHNVLLSLTRARPRDLIKLFHASAKRAHLSGSEIISTKNLQDIFESYSQERLQDIINEFKSEMPMIDQLLLRMKPSKREKTTLENYMFSPDALRTKLFNIIQQTTLAFANGSPVTPRSLTQFLYKIDFITARKFVDGVLDRKYFDQSRFLANEIIEFGYDWEIHPAYRWALQPRDIQHLIDNILPEA